jgi:hypothetical protein
VCELNVCDDDLLDVVEEQCEVAAVGAAACDANCALTADGHRITPSTQFSDTSRDVHISNDGAYLVFETVLTSFTGTAGIVLYDRRSGASAHMSRDFSNNAVTNATGARVGGVGAVVVFSTTDDALLSDNNGISDCYLYELDGSLVRISQGNNGVQLNAPCFRADTGAATFFLTTELIDARDLEIGASAYQWLGEDVNPRLIAFDVPEVLDGNVVDVIASDESEDALLVVNVDFTFFDVYRWDAETETTTNVSNSGIVTAAAASSDLQVVVWTEDVPQADPPIQRAWRKVGASAATPIAQNANVQGPVAAARNGNVLVSSYCDLDFNEVEPCPQVLQSLYRFDGNNFARVSVARGGTNNGDNVIRSAAIADDGTTMAYTSGRVDLVPNDVLNSEDVFLEIIP